MAAPKARRPLEMTTASPVPPDWHRGLHVAIGGHTYTLLSIDPTRRHLRAFRGVLTESELELEAVRGSKRKRRKR